MDINSIKESVEKLIQDEATKEQLKKDPIHTIEQTFGVDLPDEQVHAIIGHLKEKIGDGDYLDKIKEKFTSGEVVDKVKEEAEEILEKVEEGGSGIVDKIKGIFHKE